MAKGREARGILAPPPAIPGFRDQGSCRILAVIFAFPVTTSAKSGTAEADPMGTWTLALHPGGKGQGRPALEAEAERWTVHKVVTAG